MNKKEFVTKLVSLYDDINGNNARSRVEAYSIVLPKKEIDYERLYELIVNQTTSFKYSISPVGLKEMIAKLADIEFMERCERNSVV